MTAESAEPSRPAQPAPPKGRSTTVWPSSAPTTRSSRPRSPSSWRAWPHRTNPRPSPSPTPADWPSCATRWARTPRASPSCRTPSGTRARRPTPWHRAPVTSPRTRDPAAVSTSSWSRIWAGRAGRSARETTEWIRYEVARQPPLRSVRDDRPVRVRHPHRGPRHRRRRPPGAPRHAGVRATGPPGRTSWTPSPCPRRHRTPSASPHRTATPCANGPGRADSPPRTPTSSRRRSPRRRPRTYPRSPHPRSPRSCCGARHPPVSVSCVCPSGSTDPLAGFVPPPAEGPAPGQGLWFTRQVCAYVDIRDAEPGDGSLIRVQYA